MNYQFLRLRKEFWMKKINVELINKKMIATFLEPRVQTKSFKEGVHRVRRGPSPSIYPMCRQN